MRGSIGDDRSIFGVLNDDLACYKKVPKEWLNEKSDFAVQMAFDQWSVCWKGNSSFSAGNKLVDTIITQCFQ